MLAVPFYIGRGPARVFAWFHPPGEHARRCGVVVCPPIGDEQLRAHRTLRHLSLRLSRLGFPTLRFDFHGTGNSAGDERDGDRVRTWLDDLGRAVDELRARSGVREVCVAGLRFGATLAATAAAERGDIDSLILWNPFASGQRFVIESLKQHQMHRLIEPHGFAAEPKDWHPGGDQALGFLFTPALKEELSQLDLSTLTTPSRRALVVDEDAPLWQRWRDSGVELERLADRGQFLLASPHKSALPEPLLERITGWLDRAHPDRHASTTAPARIDAHEGDERPLALGERLFGVLSSPPVENRRRERPALLMLNAGTVHHVGPHRLYVKLARHFVELGFHVLRLDLSGIGDSAAAPGSDENLCYPRDALADVRTAMTALNEQLQVDRVVLVGLCSGADLAFQIALVEEQVRGLVLLNPLTFCVHEQHLVESYQPASYYTSSLVDRAKLLRLLRGQVSIRGSLTALYENVKAIVRRRQEQRSLSEDVPTRLHRLAKRGVETLLVAGDRDPGVVYLDEHFGAAMRSLQSLEQFRRVELAGTDHTFTSLYAQQLLFDTVGHHLQERYR